MASPALPAQEEKPAAPPPASATPVADEPDVDVEAEALALLDAAWDWLGAQESYAFHADLEYDEVFGEATRVRVSSRLDALVRQPDRFKVFIDGDRGRKAFYYNGESFVLADLRSRTWAAAPVTGPNDTAVDTIAGELNVQLPLSDFLVTSPAYSADELQGAYVVGESRVAGRRCHQVLLLLDDIDVQLWIEADGNPLIRKLVIVFREAPGAPQFEATFTEWYPPTQLSDYVFTHRPGDGDRHVELAAPAPAETGKE
ncbi:MAG: DUF2092 domain-containing protein [Acidobacteriota bacterium]